MTMKLFNAGLVVMGFGLMMASSAYGQYNYSFIDSSSGQVWGYSATENPFYDGADALAFLYGPQGDLLAQSEAVDWYYAEAAVESTADSAGNYIVYGYGYVYYGGWYYAGNSSDEVYVDPGLGGPPTISGISPSSGIYGQGGYISIYGTNLDPVTGVSVSLGSSTLEIVKLDDTQLNVYYPDNQPVGSYQLTVTTQAGSAWANFTIDGDPTPMVSGVSPDTWPAGTQTSAVIYGSGFGTNPSLSINGYLIDSYQITSAGDTAIYFTVTPDASAPTEQVTLTVTSGGYNGLGFQGGGGQTGNQSNSVNAQVQAASTCLTQDIIDEYSNPQYSNPPYNAVIDVTHDRKPWAPQCAWFTQTIHSAYYTFNQLGNIGNQPYSSALIKRPLFVAQTAGYGLDDWTFWLANAGYPSRQTINSTYRPPSYDASCCSGASVQGGRHKFGDAVDIQNVSGTQIEHDTKACWAGINAAYNFAGVPLNSCPNTLDAGANWIEPIPAGGCNLGCVHADWRYHDYNIYIQ